MLYPLSAAPIAKLSQGSAHRGAKISSTSHFPNGLYKQNTFLKILPYQIILIFPSTHNHHLATMSCPDCAKGGLHEGVPVGREEVLHGLPTYITDPPPGTQIKGQIVYLPDALGWKFKNSRILVSQYLCIVLDLARIFTKRRIVSNCYRQAY